MMFTSDECRKQAEQKLAQAKKDERHRRRLTTAAQGWLLLADKLKAIEVPGEGRAIVSGQHT